MVDRTNTKINRFYYWTYNDSEIQFENWIEDFIQKCFDEKFKYINNGIDVVFKTFNIEEFINHLNPYPLVHEGRYEIYIADWRDGDIVIHSIKKDTLEYVGVDPNRFILAMHKMLDYEFLTFESRQFQLVNEKPPVFIDSLLHAFNNTWMGIDEIIENFKYSGIESIDRKSIIVYYLQESEFLRDQFKNIGLSMI